MFLRRPCVPLCGGGGGSRHGSKLYFSIPPQSIPMSAMFASIESVKDRLGIMEYSLSQTSLEQVRCRPAAVVVHAPPDPTLLQHRLWVWAGSWSVSAWPGTVSPRSALCSAHRAWCVTDVVRCWW